MTDLLVWFGPPPCRVCGQRDGHRLASHTPRLLVREVLTPREWERVK